MASFVLVHGAWHGGWCWNHVAPLLRAVGHRVLTPDLQAHGSDTTPFDEVTLDRYADRICELAESEAESVVLVGHSMGGGVITQAAERCASSIAALVYLAAYMPGPGSSIGQQAMADTSSLLWNHIVLDPVSGTAELDLSVTIECFYEDCSADDVSFAHERLMPRSPLQPLITPVDVSAECWGRVPRVYIECTKDRTVTIEMQRRIHRAWPCTKVFTLDTHHSPFFSQPRELVQSLLGCVDLVD
jgi:pimeloyl-ACP methyl ester carboxylesterase